MRRNWRRGLTIGAGAIALVAAGSVAILIYAIRSLVPECVDEVLASTGSPDHRVVGAVIDRGCGATVGFVRGVVLYDASGGFSSDDSNVVYLVEGQGEIVIRWHDDTNLVIDPIEPAGQSYRMHDRWNGVAISYE